MPNNRPNLLLILTDQHIATIAGFAGDPLVRTQNLDALAQRSLQFDSASCASPLCTPSRMCLLTGKEVHHCAAWNNHWAIFPEHVTWPGHFAANGYRTCLVGKMHFGGKNQMNGFQVRPYGDLRHGLGHQPDPLSMFPGYGGATSAGVTEVPESLLQDVVVTRETLAFIREHNDTQPDVPWFVCAGYSRPHPPFTAPGRYIRRYEGKAPAPRVPAEERDHLEPHARAMADRYSRMTPDVALHGRDGYYACVDFVDDCIGELLDGLARSGMLENTIVIYSSDHGEMLGEHGIWGKTMYFEPAVAVPLLISGPGVQPGRRVSAPISLIDLFPTTAALTGLPIPAGLDGVDFSGFLAAPEATPPPRDYAPSAYYRYGVLVDLKKNPIRENQPHEAWRAVRDARYKYVDVEGGSALLFDEVADPGELQNLADLPEHAAHCAAMSAALYRDFGWDSARRQLALDRARLPAFKSGMQPTMPNQYMLPDGRTFDAESALYAARWLQLPDDTSGGIIPQQFG